MPRFEKKGVALYFSPEHALPKFPFDHLKIQHVVSNLIHNAWKFTPPRGTVWVSARTLFLGTPPARRTYKERKTPHRQPQVAYRCASHRL